MKYTLCLDRFLISFYRSVEAPRTADEGVELCILEEDWARIQVEAQKLYQVDLSITVLIEEGNKLGPNFVILLDSTAEAHALLYVEFRN